MNTSRWLLPFYLLCCCCVLSPGPLRAQVAPPPVPVVSVLRNEDNHAFVQWKTVPGFRYLLERSTDLQTWTTIPGHTFYGGGQTITTRIYTAPPPTPQAPQPPAPYPIYDFFVQKLTHGPPAQSLVTWHQDSQQKQVVVDLDLEVPGMPLMLWSGLVNTDPLNPYFLWFDHWGCFFTPGLTPDAPLYSLLPDGNADKAYVNKLVNAYAFILKILYKY